MDRRLGPQRWCVGRGGRWRRSNDGAASRFAGSAPHTSLRVDEEPSRRVRSNLRSGVGPEEARKLREVVERVQGNG